MSVAFGLSNLFIVNLLNAIQITNHVELSYDSILHIIMQMKNIKS